MDKKKLMSKIIPALVAGSVLVSTEIPALAKSSTKALHNSQKQNTKKYSRNSTDNYKSKLDELVTSSIITQEQEDKILDYLEQKETEKKAELDKVKNMTETERKTYFASNPEQKKDLLSDMVKSGIITQDQANAIKKVLPNKEDKSHEKTKDENMNNIVTN